MPRIQIGGVSLLRGRWTYAIVCLAGQVDLKAYARIVYKAIVCLDSGKRKLQKGKVLDLLFSIVVNFKEALTRSSRINRMCKLYPRTSPKRPKVPLSFLERLRLNDHDGY